MTHSEERRFTNDLNMNVSDISHSEDTSVQISRLAYNLNSFEKEFDAIESENTSFSSKCWKRLRPNCDLKRWKERVRSVLPITEWLPKYNLREDLLADIITGITVAVFQVPQSMGYCLIAHIPPVHGLYTAFFPAMVFSVLATSKHTAVGACAILSGVMTGNLVTEVMQENGVSLHQLESMNANPSSITQSSITESTDYTSGAPQLPNLESFEVATAAAFWIGIYMFLFGVLRLGFISIYLSKQLISGFATAASLYVFTSQLRYLFGVHLPYNSGMFAIIRSYIDLVEVYRDINPVTTLISIICCSILLFFKIYVNEKLRKRGLNIPFPVELLVVVSGTILSYLMDLNGRYNVQIVGEIKRGLPLPEIPRLSILKQTWLRSISLATVGYTLTLTVGKLYGNKHGYEVRPNQELVALGTTNIVASFFRCLPSTASLPRSAVQEQAGGRTQIASFVNCGTMLIVLFYLGPLLQKLPNCVLASVIAVALKNLLGNAKEFNRYWKVSKPDGAMWMVSFVGVIVLDIDFGLYFAVAFSLLVLIYKSSRPKSYILGSATNSEVYVPLKKYAFAREIPGIKIYQFCGPLHFANSDFFKSDILKKSELIKRNAISETQMNPHIIYHNPAFATEISDQQSPQSVINVYTHVIIDCSMISYCDASGVHILRKIIDEFEKCEVKVHLAACNSLVVQILENDNFFEQFPKDTVYVTVHDAVLNIVNEQKKWSQMILNDRKLSTQTLQSIN